MAENFDNTAKSCMQWHDRYCVKHDEIDRQHQEIVGLINKLADAMEKGKDERELGEIIAEIHDDLVKHFNYEEDIMQSVNYKDYQHHKNIHNGIVQKLQQFEMENKGRNKEMSRAILKLLNSWLPDHIQIRDIALANAIASSKKS
jgi:hemerythrin